MTKEQKKDVLDIFDGWKNAGDLDYVCCWYKKASDYISTYHIRCALVSTNSICQGGSVINLWKPLFESGIHIDYAYRTFRWDSEAAIQAKVHCIIVGFSRMIQRDEKYIYTDGVPAKVHNINGYLLDADNVFIEKRMRPVSDVPEIALGGQAIDDGNLVLTEQEKNEIISAEPMAEGFIRPYMMGKDFINRRPRYCIWLVNADPGKIKKCPSVLRRIENVRKFRLSSTRTSTLKAADIFQ